MINYIESIIEGEYLSRERAQQAMEELASGLAIPEQVASFLTSYQFRSVSADELDGFRLALLNLASTVNLSEFDPMDVCGTGGDGKNSFNISTLSAFVAAGAGAKIAKHGNYSVSSKCGSSDVLQFFGIPFNKDEDLLKRDLEKAGICILHAPLFHPALKHVAAVRKNLQMKTLFNMLGPLIHPANPKKRLCGVYSMELAELYKEVLAKSDNIYSIIHSTDGYDEVSLTAGTRVITNASDQILSPRDLGFDQLDPNKLLGGEDLLESAKIFENILTGKGTKAQNSCVIANAAIAIQVYTNQPLDHCVEAAGKSLQDKKALKSFTTLLNL